MAQLLNLPPGVAEWKYVVVAPPNDQGRLRHRTCRLWADAARHAPRSQVEQRGLVKVEAIACGKVGKWESSQVVK